MDAISTGFRWISLGLGKSVVASLMWPHLEVQKWTKCCWKWRREDSHKWNSMLDHYRKELKWGIWESLTLESPDLSIFDYSQLHPDLMLITFQFSWGTFSFAQSHIRSIQLVKTANGTFIIPQVQCNSLFGLAHKFKGHCIGYNTCCNYLSFILRGNPWDVASRAPRKQSSAPHCPSGLSCTQVAITIYFPSLTVCYKQWWKILKVVCHFDGL